MDFLDTIIQTLISAGTILLVLGLFASVIAVLAIWFLTLFKNRKREARSLDSVLLQIAVPRNNEVKIDAAQQMFSSLYSL